MVKLVRAAEKSERRASTERMIEFVMRIAISGPCALLLMAAATELVIPRIVDDSMKRFALLGGAYAFAEIPMRQSRTRQRMTRTVPLKALMPLGSSVGETRRG